MSQGSRFRLHTIVPACFKANLLLAFFSFVGISIYSGTKLFFIFSDAPAVKASHEDLINNWSSDLIKQIIEISPKDQCPGNYTELFRFEWKGTPESCSCIEGSLQDYPFLTKTVYNQLCNSTMTEAGCEPIEGSLARPLFLYNDRKLCVQRMAETSFFLSINNMNEDGTCKEGFIQCGGMSNQNASLCINASLFDNGCPIMDISSAKQDPSYSRIGNSTLYYSKSQYLASSPYSEIKLTNTSSCFTTPEAISDPRDQQRASKNKVNPCVYGGPGYLAIDEGIEATTYFSKQGISYAADPSTVADQTIKLFKRSYFNFPPSCRRELLYFTDYASLTLSPQRTQFLWWLSTFLISSSSIGLLVFSLTLVIRPSSKIAISVRYMAGLTVIALSLVAVEMSYFVTSTTHSYFETLVQLNCGDSLTIPTFQKLALMTNLDTVFKRDMLVVLGLIILVGNLFRVIGFFVRARLLPVKSSSDPAFGVSELSAMKAESQIPAQTH